LLINNKKNEPDNMNKYIAEFIGTFFLVLTIGCTGIGAGAGVIAPLAIGIAEMQLCLADSATASYLSRNWRICAGL